MGCGRTLRVASSPNASRSPRGAVADAALLEFQAFAERRAERLSQCASAGALAAQLARDAALKLSAADALHLALSTEGPHGLVTFDLRLAEAAQAAGFSAEIP
jgi:predicted nucleic acid-binding protein